MSIKHQAMFWLKNVNDYTDEYGDSPALADGYLAFSDLMKAIYRDYQSYEISTAVRVRTKIGIMADDLENYHNLTNTIDCLYRMAVLGILSEEGSVSFLEIEKAVFKKTFKGSVTFPFQILENHGFYFKYLKNGNETSAYKNCDKFYLFSDLNTELIPALKHMSSASPALDAKDDYIGKENMFFSLSDFESILLKRSRKQTDISPLKQVIMNTTGNKGELWRSITESFINDLKLTTRAYINPYVFPNWTVKFIYKKKTIITFNISFDTIGVSLPLSYEMAKNVIMNKGNLPDIIRKSIENFGCMGCGKCLSQNGIEIFEGVPLCGREASNSLGESPRSIRGNIVSQEEAKTICDITKGMI